MQSIKEWLNKILFYAGAFFLTIIVVMVSLEVFCRFIMKVSLPWASEVATLALVWMIFLIAAYAVSLKSNIQIEFFRSCFSAKVKRAVGLMVDFILLILFLWLFLISFNYTVMIATARSAALQISQGYLYAAVPISAFLMLFYTICGLLESLNILGRVVGKGGSENGD
jgi:TRAP-type C4-dicarboxylate transport system permease small subunit